jgi:hypothetical protein
MLFLFQERWKYKVREEFTVSIRAKFCENWLTGSNASKRPRGRARTHTHTHSPHTHTHTHTHHTHHTHTHTHTHTTHKVYILCRVHALNVYRGRTGITPLIPYLGARRDVLSALRFERLGLLKTTVGWPHIWSGRVGEEKHQFPWPALEPRILQPIVYPLYRLRYLVSVIR